MKLSIHPVSLLGSLLQEQLPKCFCVAKRDFLTLCKDKGKKKSCLVTQAPSRPLEDIKVKQHAKRIAIQSRKLVRGVTKAAVL